MYRAFLNTVRNHAGNTALVTGAGRISYEELDALVAGFAQGLAASGIGPGGCFAIRLANSVEFVCAFLAAARIGCLILPLDPRLKPFEVERMMRDAGAALVLGPDDATALCIPGVSGLADSGTVGDLLVQYSSGSMGLPKQVRRTHGNLLTEAANFAESTGTHPGDVILGVAPLFHAHGLGNALLAAMYAGGTLVLIDGPAASSESLLKTIEQERVTVFPGVPFLFAALASAPVEADLSRVRLCFSAGNFLPRETFDSFQKRFGVPIRQLYGCTEAGSVTLNLDKDVAATWDSTGLPLRGSTVQIVNGEVGFHSGALTNASTGLFFPGDLGRLDDAGRLYITGRKRRIIDVGGKKVDAAEVEQVLLSHPGVAEAAVVGVAAARGGELIKAVVVTRGSCGRDELDAWCRSHMADFKTPAILELAGEIPRSPLGKILRGKVVSARPSAVEVEKVVREVVAELSGVSPAQLNSQRPLMEFGVDSVGAVRLAARLQTWLGTPVEATLIWNYPTIAAIATHISGAQQDSPPIPYASREEPVAIIGMSCRFPGGANNPEDFWQLLANGRDAVTEVPAERWNVDALYDPDPAAPGKMASRWGGFIDNVDQFDAAFFGVSPREAVRLDPQQRVLLEVAWEALEDAGQAVEKLAGSPTGVFIGMSNSDYFQLQIAGRPIDDAYLETGNRHSFAAGRVSYLMDFRGPAVTLDTVCSSSLVAVHLASQSLRAGDCTMAVAGGINLILSPLVTIMASKWGMMSPDGRCKPFDARANGFVRGEGCGLVVLKRLSDAMRAGDPILAVIRGSSVNQDGRSAGLTAPNGQAQREVIRNAIRNSSVEPRLVEYIEAHGSGTALGDPIEVEALAEVYGRTGGEPCVLGAVKSNIGHAEAAAGVAALIKAVLALRNEAIPPNLHFERLNPNISLDGTRLVLADRLRPWRSNGRPRHVAVSSFGLSGTNAHMVLEEAPARPAMAAPEERVWLLPVSARSEKAARAQAVAWQEYLRGSAVPPLRDLCHTAGVRRSHHAYRLTAVGRTPEQMLASLESAAPVLAAGTAPGPVFVFPGQGGQWVGMGRELLRTEPVFGKVIEECGQAMARDLAAELEGDWSEAGIDRIQPLLFAVSAGLAVLWRSWGIEPSTVVGHSMGEVAAAYVAGGLELGDAVRIVCTRSLLLRRVTGQGAMAMVEKSRQQAEELAARSGGRISLAVENSPRSAVLAGDRKALEELGRELEERGEYFRWVQVEVASHSSQVDELLEELREQLGGITGRRLQVPMYSTVEERVVKGEELNGAYWVRNLREPVRFAGVVERLVGEGYRRYVEVSPHMVLGGAVREAGGEVVVGSLRRGEEERRAMLESLGELYASGSGVEWGAVNAEGECVRVPGYAWQRERYWLEDVENAFEWGEEEVAEHRVEGAAVLAGSGYVQLAAEAAGSGAITVEGMEWKRLLSVKGRRRVKVSLRGDRFAVYSEEAGEWVEHGGGRVTKLRADGPTGDKEAIEAARRRCGERIGAEAWYRAMSGKGLEYGGAHRGVEEAWLGNGEAVARVDGKRSLTGLLDSCFQVLGETSGTQSGLRVPVRADRIAVYGEVRGELWVWARAAGGEIDAIDDSGRTVIEVRGLELRALDSEVRDEIGSWLYRWQWRPQSVPRQAISGRWAVLGDGGIKSDLCAALKTAGAEVSEAASGTCRGIVALWGLEGEAGWEPVLQLAQELAQRGGRDMPRLWLVTRGLAGSLLWGLGRTVMYEHPELRCTVVEMGEGASAAELAAEVLADSAEDQVMLRAGERYVGRLMPGGSLTEPVLQEAGAEAFAAEMVQPGQLRGVGLRMKPRKRPGPGEVEVEVMAAGVNFLDVLTALGERLGEEIPEMGSEFAGRIVAIGEGVEEWKSGDELVGCAPGSWGTHVCVRGESVARKPAGMSFEEAAALPVVYATAWHSLRERARVQAGERVLIHSAAGATGLAMVVVARSLGAEVVATAGTEEKRAYLRRLGIEQVMDSRTVQFAEQVRDVDVVVNGLTGESVKASLGVLKRHGRLVELGKREIYGGGRLELGSFRKGLTYHAVDLLGMQREEPGEFGKLLREVMGSIERGELKRGPVQVLGIASAGEALERLAGGKQIGKLVLSLRERERVKVEGYRGVRGEGVYLITGGMGGIGLRVAEWLVERGARQLVLAGREIRGDAAVEQMREQGAEVWVRQVDVACGEQVEALVEETEGKLGQLRGVMHAAGVLDDGVLARMSRDQFRSVLGAKVEGAKHLDRVTRGRKLDWFVMFSSVASVLGSPGQGNYAAGNAYLDALAGERRLRGEVGQSINWGPWSGVGLAAAQENRGVRLTDRGIGSMTPEQGLEALGRVLESGWEQVVVMPFDLRQWRQYYPKRGTAASFAEIPQRGRNAGGEMSALRGELAAAEPSRRRQLLAQHLREQVAQVLRLNQDHVQEDMPLGRIGFDSLSALELRNRLEAALTLELPGTLIWRHPTIRSVATYLLERLGLSTPATPAAAATAATVVVSDSSEVRRHVEQLSDEEVRLALRQRRPLNR